MSDPTKVTCPICSSADVGIARYEGMYKGVTYSAKMSRCRHCGEEFFTKEQSKAAYEVAGSTLLLSRKPSDPGCAP